MLQWHYETCVVSYFNSTHSRLLFRDPSLAWIDPYITVCPLPGFRKQEYFFRRTEFLVNSFNLDEVFIPETVAKLTNQVCGWLCSVDIPALLVNLCKILLSYWPCFNGNYTFLSPTSSLVPAWGLFHQRCRSTFPVLCTVHCPLF